MAKTEARVAHVFVSADGELKPRWQEAFSDAVAVQSMSISGCPDSALVWLHLVQGLEAARQVAGVAAQAPSARIVALSDLPGDEEALAAFGAGARGYCNSHAAALLLRRIADTVAQGGLWIGPSLMQRLLRGVARLPLLPANGHVPVALTPRDLEVAALMARGSSEPEMAAELGVTSRTVRSRAAAVMGKLGVRDRLQLALALNRRAASLPGEQGAQGQKMCP